MSSLTPSPSSPLISDLQSLVSASRKCANYSVKTYDDGFGALFILRDSMSILGIIRAQTWEDAYSIAEDEFFPEASESMEEIRAEYNFKRSYLKQVDENGEFKGWRTVETPSEDENGFMDNELFQESFGFRPNGANSSDTQGHGIYSKDLNGESLELLTPSLLSRLEITLKIEENE